MPSSRTDHLEPLPIPFGTKADGTAYTWPADNAHRCFWGVLSNDGERRIVAITHAGRADDISTKHPGYPDAYLMQGRYRYATVGIHDGNLHPDSRLWYAAYDWSVSPDPVNQWPVAPPLPRKPRHPLAPA